MEPLRVLIAEDQVLLRTGIARLLTDAGMDVVAQAGDAEDLLRKARAAVSCVTTRVGGQAPAPR